MRRFVDYKPISVDMMAQLFSQCLPQGLAWNSKGDQASNFYLLLRSLADQVIALQVKLYELVVEWNINVTNNLITEWETAVGIPDECRGVAESIEVRRSDVLDKLRKVPVITVADYEALAESITGEVGWNIRPGSQDFPSDPLFKFVLLITAPTITAAAFDYPFGSGFESGIGITRSGTTVTVTVSDTSTMVLGGLVVIAGADQAEYNGTHTIATIPTGATFTYEIATTPATPATGTITVTFGIDQTQLDALAANFQFILTPGTVFSGYPLAGSLRTDVLRCVLRKVIPANVTVVFN